MSEAKRSEPGCFCYIMFWLALMGCCNGSTLTNSAAHREAEREHAEAEHLRSQLRILKRHLETRNDDLRNARRR